jgi:hydroxymethylpyrimidine/phosphomethylpyrimidine kinase
VKVEQVEYVRPVLILHQLRAVLDDIPPNAAKTGALGNRAIVEAVAEAAADFKFPLIVDPVMISKHGVRLMAKDAYEALRTRLIPRAYLVTPNLAEASELAGFEIRDVEGMRKAARAISELGAETVLVKGGHLAGGEADQSAIDVLYTADGHAREFTAPRIRTEHTHGTGCTYSAAITANLARGLALEDAITRAKVFITAALRTAPGLGRGVGPVNHHAMAQSATGAGGV